jgi:hypothetical protein
MNRTFRANPAARWLILLSVCLALLTFTLPTRAQATSGGVDAVLVMDSSGSMAKNDPKKLRVPAAKLFMSLLGENDRIGLVSFSDNGYPVLHLSAPGPKNNARILASADKVSSKGIYTNLHAALVKGVAMLDKEGQQGQEKMLVLMSDGRMDVGNTDEDWALTQKIQGELLQDIKAKGIKVYTIAFTEASDADLLKEVAMESGALFKLARSDKDLHEVFSAIFESAKQPDMLPVEGGEFVVDASIEEVTIVASKEREDVRIYLQSPDDKKLSSDDVSESLKWFMSSHFDMITVHNPTPGTWKILFSGGRNRAYIVTNMALMHNPQQPNLAVGEDMVLESWLEQDSKLLDREAVLTNTRFVMKIEAPDGARADFELYDTGEYGDGKIADGVYSNTLSYENPGSYKIDIIAESETFKRQKTVHFEVAPAPVSLDAPIPVEEEPVVEAPPEPEPAPKEQVETGAADETDVAEDEEAAQAEEPKARKKGINMVFAIGVFVGVNVLLGLIGFGIWWFLKKRKQKATTEDDEEDEAEAEDK